VFLLQVRRAFFDKTGTLTKQGLDFISAKSSSTWDAAEETVPLSDDMALGMATCHSLTRSANGNLIGSPVDRTMFAASGADFRRIKDSSVVITDAKGNAAEILKHFDFDHHRMTQSVIVKTGGRIVAFVKGSGESLQRICCPDSLPSDFTSTLRSSAKAGIYQISIATKQLSPEVEANLPLLSRDEIERDLTFTGVVDFKNVLREETPAVIRELEDGEVRCVMVTGDSVLTGICIAKESGIIVPGRRVLIGAEFDSQGNVVWLDEDDGEVTLPSSLDGSDIDLAVTGEVWQSLLRDIPKMEQDLAEHIRIYGRCTPVDKVSVVTTFIDRGYITLMCGDGGNDCGALKTAHVGIALSDAEASIVSAFTSLDKNIVSVVHVLREGRCALASALASYKFMIMYGQITLANNIINAYFSITFTEWSWVFMDGIWTIALGFSLPLSKAAHKLAASRPSSSLLGPHTLSSALGVLFIHVFCTVISLATLFRQDWFQCRKWENDADVSNVLVIGDNYETGTIWLVTGYQFISSAMAYNFGYEWRGSWISNRWFVSLSVLFSLIHFYITLVPGYLSCLFRINCDNDHAVQSVTQGETFPIQNPYNTTVMPLNYRLTVFFIMVANTVAVMAWDYHVVNNRYRWHRNANGFGSTKTRNDKPDFVAHENALL
jgi:magnesium-transporting ATPase (P-type)